VDDDRVLALRYDDDAGGCLLTLCNLSADEVRFAVEEPDNLRVVEVLADRQYPDADLASMVLGRYGYRWLHCVA
jgi:hypothetical protein